MIKYKHIGGVAILTLLITLLFFTPSKAAFITAPSGADNLGDHSATQNIKLNTFWLSGDGGSEGIYINSSGNVGIGTVAPAQRLHVNGSVQATSFLGNATTATALAANGSNCSAGYYPLGVNASGAAESCTLLPTGTGGGITEDIYWTGTATNLVAATGRTSLGLGSLATLNAVSGGTGGTITDSSITTVDISNGTILDADISASTDITATKIQYGDYFISSAGTSGNVWTSDGSGAGIWSASAPKATALAANGTNCSAGYYPLGVDASGAAESCTLVPTGGGTGTVTGTGTTNYVSKWTGTSAQGNSIIFDNGTNVGIGTNNPSSTLVIYTNTGSGSLLKLIGSGPSVNASIHFMTDGGSLPKTGLFQLDLSGNMVFRTYQSGLYFDARSTAGIHFRTTDSNTERITIINNGNVGIGITAPTQKLDVVGYVKASSGFLGNATTATSLAANGANCSAGYYPLGVNASGAGRELYFIADGGGTGTVTGTGITNYVSKWTSTSSQGNGIIVDNGTNVGVGTSTPSEKLQISGNIKLDSGNTQNKIISNSTNGLVLENTGNIYGPVRLVIQNISGMNGALFQNDNLDLVDFGFIGSGGVKQNIRYEHRADLVYLGNTSGQFEIGPAGSENFVIGAGVSAFLSGNVGIGTTTPTQKLDVVGYVKASSGFLGNATTATSLAANGANCSAGYYPLGVNASGAAESCTLVPTGTGGGITEDIYWTGTATNLVAATGRTSLGLGSLATLNAVSGGTGGTITDSSITTVDISNGTILDADISASTDITATKIQYGDYFISSAGTNGYVWISDGTGAGIWSASAPKATALAANGTNCSAGYYPLGVDASGAAESCTLVPTGGGTGTVTGTGITNYVSKWTSTSSQGNGIIVDNGTNVGIGTLLPFYKLDVSGNINIDGNSAYLQGGYNTIKLATKGDTVSYSSIIIGKSAGDDITDGTTKRQIAIGLSAGSANGEANQIALGYQAGMMNDGANQIALGYQAGIMNQGAQVIGIGYGATFSNTGNDVVAIGYEAGKDNTVANQFIVKQNNINSTPLIQGDFSSGNVGIGTTNPLFQFHVEGVSAGINLIRTNSNNALDPFIRLGDGTVFSQMRVDRSLGGDIYFTTNDSANEQMRITSTGNVGIGTATPTQKLDVVGYVKASSGFLGNATTATSLAANGSNCSAGYYPLGVNASGAAESCTLLPTGTGGGITEDIYWTGTATNLVAATGRTSLGLGSLATLNAVSGGTGGTITDSSITTVDISNGTILDADISASTDITATKIQYGDYFISSAGTSGNVWTSDGSGAGTWAAAPSGGTDIYWTGTATNLVAATGRTSLGLGSLATLNAVSGGTGGTITDSSITTVDISNGTILDADISASTDITATKIQYGDYFISSAGTNGYVWTSDGTGAGIWSASAPKATSLAANGSNCSAGYYPLGVDASGAAESCTLVPTGGGTGTVTGTGTANYVSKWTGTSSQGNGIIFDNGTNVGIGSTNPQYKLDVVGTSGIGADAFIYRSDRNLKFNIKKIDNALEKIKALEGVTFKWRVDGSSSIGLIAQDVEKVFPELVTGKEGKRGVQYGNLVAPLIEAIKEQQQQIDNLQQRIVELEKRQK